MEKLNRSVKKHQASLEKLKKIVLQPDSKEWENLVTIGDEINIEAIKVAALSLKNTPQHHALANLGDMESQYVYGDSLQENDGASKVEKLNSRIKNYFKLLTKLSLIFLRLIGMVLEAGCSPFYPFYYEGDRNKLEAG